MIGSPALFVGRMILSDPVLRDELLDARVGVIVDACEHICEVGLGINFGLPAVFNQGEHDGRSGSGIGVAYEQPIFGTEFEWSQSVLYAELLIMPSWPRRQVGRGRSDLGIIRLL